MDLMKSQISEFPGENGRCLADAWYDLASFFTHKIAKMSEFLETSFNNASLDEAYDSKNERIPRDILQTCIFG